MAGYPPIEEHGMIGDLHTVALVGSDGTIDWYCCPSFDSPSVFGSILDERRGGSYRIAPACEVLNTRQLYLPDTNVLITRFLTEDGVGDYAPHGHPDGDIRELFEATVAYWRRWLSQSRYTGRWREMVHRSALTLKLLTYEPTGAIVAAATTSLPEQLGGERNWDYRYTWIRDAAFSLYALLRLGPVGWRRCAPSRASWSPTASSTATTPARRPTGSVARRAPSRCARSGTSRRSRGPASWTRPGLRWRRCSPNQRLRRTRWTGERGTLDSRTIEGGPRCRPTSMTI